jgi:flagellar biosynthesis GTPase FlhF
MATVEIVHESLISGWPTLRRWLEESGEDAAFIEQLRQASRTWATKNRPADLLWRGELADEAQRFQRRYKGPLGEQQKAFLDAVVEQLGAAARRRRSVLVGAVAGLSLLVAASFVALIVIQGARAEAQRQAEAATVAEGEARKNADEAKKNAEEARKNAEEARENEEEANKLSRDLSEKSKKLELALKAAEDARQAAEQSQKSAIKNAVEAEKSRQASERARRAVEEARRDLQQAYAKEQDRAKRLEEQLGGGVIDVLK